MSNAQVELREIKHGPVLTKGETSPSLSAHQTVVNNRIKDVKKDYGIFFTPEKIVDFMVNLIKPAIYRDKKDITV